MSGVFMASAFTFQPALAALKAGNPAPLGVWAATNAGLMTYHFGAIGGLKGLKYRGKNLTESVAKLNKSEVDQLIKAVDEVEPTSAQEIGNILDDLQMRAAKGTLTNDEYKEFNKKLKTHLLGNPEVVKNINDTIESLSEKEIAEVLESAGIDITKVPLTKEEKNKALRNIMLGATGLVLGSITLDQFGINPIVDSTGLDKDGIAFYGASVASSLPEFALTLSYLKSVKKVQAKGSKEATIANRDGGESAAQNISDSNAINIMLAKAAAVTAFARGEKSEDSLE
jgi:hypothetical protein